MYRREESKIMYVGDLRSWSLSLVIVGSWFGNKESGGMMMGSSDYYERERMRGFGYFKWGKEVDEMEVREDLVVWMVFFFGGEVGVVV